MRAQNATTTLRFLQCTLYPQGSCSYSHAHPQAGSGGRGDSSNLRKYILRHQLEDLSAKTLEPILIPDAINQSNGRTARKDVHSRASPFTMIPSISSVCGGANQLQT